MSADVDPIFYDDDGNALGYIAEAEDGAMVLHDGEGNILDAATPDGAQLDPSAYAMDYAYDQGAYPADDTAAQLDALQQQVAELEQQRMIHEEVARQMPAASAAQTFDPQTAAQQIHTRYDLMQRSYGRELSNAEINKVMEEAKRQVDAGADVDFDYAAAQAGIKHADAMDRHDRVAWASERLQDQDAAATADDPPPSYDLDTHAGRAAYMDAKLNGDESASERTYDGGGSQEAA